MSRITSINAEILVNKPTARGIYQMALKAAAIAEIAQPGQFLNIYVDRQGFILPRPISICAVDSHVGVVTVVYQVAGQGTKCLSQFNEGASIRVMGPLGNGFILPDKEAKIALLGGGIGLPPLYFLAQRIKEEYPAGEVRVFAGFKDGGLAILENEFKSIGVTIDTATDDGSLGYRGNVLECLASSGFRPDAIFACGPGVMLRAVSSWAENNNVCCSVSLEERMACGLGACVGCVVKIKADNPQGWAYKKVCKDGPVFSSGEVLWQ